MRLKPFLRNDLLEELLAELAEDLRIAERALLKRRNELLHPLILVMGPPRCGSTLFMQWLANSELVAYPTNLLARFYYAPIIGAKIQLLLTDPKYEFRDELKEFKKEIDYRSENGKTQGILAPNEFWYFWRRFLKDSRRDIWTDEELRETMDVKTMLGELAGVTEVMNKPFVMKGMLFNYNISFLDSVIDKVVFIQLKRNLESNAESVLDARKRQFGDVKSWYSFEIPEKEALLDLDPATQVRKQVMAIDRAVDLGVGMVEVSRKLVIHYEDFCSRPRFYFELLAKMLGRESLPYKGPERFLSTR